MSTPSTCPDTLIFPVTVKAPVAAVPVVAIFCDPKLGAILVPAIAADALTSALSICPAGRLDRSSLKSVCPVCVVPSCTTAVSFVVSIVNSPSAPVNDAC